MRLTFTFDSNALMRPRPIRLVTVRKPAKYQINSDPVYQPLHNFIASYKTSGYLFNLLELFHATGLKMLSRPGRTPLQMMRRTFLVTGGLYLALDIKHPDLAIRESFGDFTSGFSHQFGVGLSALSMSQAFDINWDAMQAIDVKRKKVLDFYSKTSGREVLIEAKGVTCWSSRYGARSSIFDKKEEERKPVQQGGSSSTVGTPRAMVGIIVHALNSEKAGIRTGTTGRKKEPLQAEMEIIDPDFGTDAVFSEEGQRAGRYWHYAGAATFAGLYDVAEELMNRADALIVGRQHRFRTRFDFGGREVLRTQNGRSVVGIQWQPSDRAELPDDVWFYQALDRNVLRNLLENDTFPDTVPYHAPQFVVDNQDYVENIFPDGSYFGIGTTQRRALRPLKLGGITNKDMQY